MLMLIIVKDYVWKLNNYKLCILLSFVKFVSQSTKTSWMDNYTTEIKQSNRGFGNGKNKGMLNIGYFLVINRKQERVAT